MKSTASESGYAFLTKSQSPPLSWRGRSAPPLPHPPHFLASVAYKTEEFKQTTLSLFRSEQRGL